MGSGPQFHLRTILGGITLMCAILACIRFGALACASFGAAIGMFGYRCLDIGFRREVVGIAAAIKRKSSLAALLFTALLTILLFALGWWPNDTSTWMYFIGVNAWELLLIEFFGHRGARQRYSAVLMVPILSAAYPLFWVAFGSEDMGFPFFGSHLYSVSETDVRRLTLARSIDLRKNGANHELIGKYVVLDDERWEPIAVFGDGHLFGGPYRPNTHSVLLRPTLPRILRMLPSKDARRTVVDLLANRKNYLRVHQGLLLTSVAFLGPPCGQKLDEWWVRQRKVFVSVEDATRAAEMALGWVDRVSRRVEERRADLLEEEQYELALQMRVAKDYELAGARDDVAFSEAFQAVVGGQGNGTGQSKRAAPISVNEQ